MSRDLQAFERVPGLFLGASYFTPWQCDRLIDASLKTYQQLEVAIETGNQEAGNQETGRLETVHVPQPEFVLSQEHNLASQESFMRVRLPESDTKTLRCEYFPEYGEPGHALAYFRGTKNLPEFILSHVPDVTSTVNSLDLLDAGADVNWKLTMNFYKNHAGKVAGFPFHVDIPANGVVTMILNIQREALFQITNGDITEDIQLEIGSLLILSNESRYEWKHRVLPADVSPEESDSDNEVKRISLVLGYS